MSEIVIELAKPEDTNSIIEICRVGYRFTTKDFKNQEKVQKAVDKYYNEKRVKDEILNHSDSWQGWVVAIQNGHVVGAAGGGLYRDNKGMLYVIYLDLHFRRQGIGTKLVNYVTDQQKQIGLNTQLVSVLKSNENAIKFYESIGFTFCYEKIDKEDLTFTSIILERVI